MQCGWAQSQRLPRLMGREARPVTQPYLLTGKDLLCLEGGEESVVDRTEPDVLKHGIAKTAVMCRYYLIIVQLIKLLFSYTISFYPHSAIYQVVFQIAENPNVPGKTSLG